MALPSSLAFMMLAGGSPASAEAWRIRETPKGWELLRDGEPFFIKGAVAPNRFQLIAEKGGNAVRIHRPTSETLDEVQAAGLVAMVNLPVRGERNGIDWDNEEQVAAQKERSLAIVREMKDHPAVMFWSVGNELDHIPGRSGYNPKLWARLNDIARGIKAIDPHHPVMTVIGTGRLSKKIQPLAKAGDAFDLLGVNAYGKVEEVAELISPYWEKPYAITEWGPTGHWEVSKTSWGAPKEETSAEKADAVLRRYRKAVLAESDRCLGSFAFYWSEKQETTHTWYGLFRDGMETESIDALQRLWTGEWPENRAPQLLSFGIEAHGAEEVVAQPGSRQQARVEVRDPEGEPLEYRWEIRREVFVPKNSYAGGLEEPAQPLPGLIESGAGPTATFMAPVEKGAYRVFVTVVDPQGKAAYANQPFHVGPVPER